MLYSNIAQSNKLNRDEVAAQRKAKQAQKEARKQAALDKKTDDKASKSTKPPKPTTTQSHDTAHAPASSSSATQATATSRPVPTLAVNAKSPVIQSTSPHKQATQQPTRPHTPRSQLQYDDTRKVAKHVKSAVVQRTETIKQLILFSHLPQYEHNIHNLSHRISFNGTTHTGEQIHSAVVKFGLLTASGYIRGSNSRCIAMLHALYELISDYTTPHNTVLSRDLQGKLKPVIRFIDDCRPKCIAMGNAIRWLKMKISKISASTNEHDAKQHLLSEINNYITERIVIAVTVIVQSTVDRIVDGDVIMVYGVSTVVENVLIGAHKQGKHFDVIVCDNRPALDGQRTAQVLLDVGIDVQYVLINSIQHVLSRVTKALIGAYACLSNGAVISTIGCSLLGLHCYNHHISLLVVCETYKFHERVQLDSICFNELADPDLLIRSSANDGDGVPVLHDWRDIPSLKLLNLHYDCIPAQYVTMIVTEVGCIPSTSVPVVLREYNKFDEVVLD